MPISISSSGRSNVGLPAAGTVHEVSAMPMLRPLRVDLAGDLGDGLEVAALVRGRPDDLLEQDGDADAAPSGGVEAVLHGDVVVDDDRLDLDALSAAASSAAISKFMTSPV